MGNLQVRFLEGWAPAMAPGHSTIWEPGPTSSVSGNAHPVKLAFTETWQQCENRVIGYGDPAADTNKVRAEGDWK